MGYGVVIAMRARQLVGQRLENKQLTGGSAGACRRGFVALLALVLTLGACAHPPAARDARTAEPTAEERARAERVMFSGLVHGVESYQLAPGDTLQLLFTEDPRAIQPEYLIGVRDKLRIEFVYQPNATRTVIVRPDGKITLPMQGDVMAAGTTPEQLATRIRDLYRDIYREPVVTVSVEEFSSAVTDLTEAVKTAQQGRARQTVIGPDGSAYLPLLPPLKAGGLTVEQLQQEVNRRYAERFPGVAVSVSLERAAGDRVFVFGEVRAPGMVAVTRPMTALQFVTAVGGPLVTGAMDRVKMLSWTSDGQSQVRTLDLEGVMQGRTNASDVLIGPNTVLYVPPTTIARLDRFVDQYIRQLFLFNGTSVNAIYQINDQSTTVRTVPK